MPQKRKPKRKRLARVTVMTEPRDEVDWDRFAWALLQYARVLVENQGAEEQAEP
jgi:hypothetical protein